MIGKIKYCYLFVLALRLSPGISQTAVIDSLKLVLKNAKHDTTRCNVLNAMVEAEPDDKVWSLYNKQLGELANKNIEKNEEPKKIYLKYLAASWNNIGYLAQQKQGDISKALEYYQKSLKIQEQIGDQTGIASSLNNIGQSYLNQGNIPMALDYIHKGLAIQEKIGDKNGSAYSFNNLGLIYHNQRDLPNALVYYDKSLKIQKALGDRVGEANSYVNIGSVYHLQKNIFKALEYYKQSLKIQEEDGDKFGIATSYNNIGFAYKDQGDLPSALDYYAKSLKLREVIGDKKGVAHVLINIAMLLLKKDQLNEASVHALRSMKLSKEIGFPDMIKESANALKMIFQKQNKYKDAFAMYELEIKMRDSINNQESQKAAVKKQMQYDYDKKELLMKAEQDKKDVISKEELKQKEKERNYFIAGFGLVIALALFILRGYRQKQKDNKLITHQKHLVEEKQKEILDSIHYAKRIQTALMSSEKNIDKTLNRMLARPKDNGEGN